MARRSLRWRISISAWDRSVPVILPTPSPSPPDAARFGWALASRRFLLSSWSYIASRRLLRSGFFSVSAMWYPRYAVAARDIALGSSGLSESDTSEGCSLRSGPKLGQRPRRRRSSARPAAISYERFDEG